MINNIIKEEREEEEISSKDDALSGDNKNNINNINNKENNLVEASKEESSIINLSNIKVSHDSELNISDYSGDILPTIYSKYKNKPEPTKKKVLITSSNINLNEKDDEERTILHRACLQIKLDIIKDLAPKLTDKYVNQLDKYNNSPLILACKYPNDTSDREKILKILIENKANIHYIEPINGWTALHWCCHNGDLSSVKLLISYGANFFIPSKNGYFTIDLAGKRLFYELVSYLIKITTDYLQKIGEYELLNVENLLSENIQINNKIDFTPIDNNNEINFGKKTAGIGGLISFKNKNKKFEENNFQRRSVSGVINKTKTKSFIDLSDFTKINKTIYLRLFTEHCLYWACYFNYNEKVINMFLSLYNARPGFPLFCLDNRTALHAACAKGSLNPFQIVYRTYEKKREKKLKQDSISDKRVPVTMFQKNEYSNNDMRVISYPDEFNKYKKELFADKHFNSFDSAFKDYIKNNFFELIYPKTLIEKLPLNKIVDKDGNTPITLACRYNNQKFIKELKEKNLVENIYDELKPENNLGFTGYYYLKNLEFRRAFLKEAGYEIYVIPPVVLELNKNSKTISSINLIMKIAKKEGLIVSLMQHIDRNKLYLLVDINENLFYEQCEKEKLEMKLLDKNLFLKFENNKKFIDSVEPFLSRHYQNIITKCISNCFDTDMLSNQKILNQTFLTHLPNITSKIYNTLIKRPFYSLNPICFFFDFLRENKNCTYSYIKLLYSYFGESISMYYAFYAYLTIMYCPLALASIAYAISYKSALFTAQDIYPTFFIIFAIWNMFISIKWKRKCNEIQQKWGLKVSADYQIIRPEFKGDEYYTDLDAPLEKHVSEYDSFISFFSTLPLIILLLGANVFIFYFTTKWEDGEKNNIKFFYRYLPSIVRSIAMVIIAKIYDIIARYSTYLENRKQEDIYEFIMSIKIYVFRLISDFTAAIYSAIVTRDIFRLKTLLYTHICIKYLSEIGSRFFYPIIVNHFFIKIYLKKVHKKTKKYSIKKNNYINSHLNINIELNNNKINNGVNLKLKENNIRDNNNAKSEENLINKNQNQLTTLKEIINENEKYNRVSIISMNDNKSNIFNINPDFIEIQKIFYPKAPVYYDYADILITHSLISLFAIIIPFAPLFCFIFSIISQNARLYIDIFHLKRPTPLSCKNIKTWNKLLELNVIIMTFTNLFLYYFYGTDNFFLKKKTANNIEIILFSGEKNIFGIICAEHLFIMIYFLLKKLISEMPNWVKKEKENLLGYYQIMSLEKKKREDLEISLKIEKFKNQKKELEQEKKIQKEKIDLYENHFDLIDKEILFKEKKIKEYEKIFDEIKKEKQIINKNKNRRNSIQTMKIYQTPKIKNIIEKKIENIQDLLEKNNEEIIFTNSLSLSKNAEKNIFLSSKKIKKNINIKMDKAIEKAIKEIISDKSFNILNTEQEENNVDSIEVYFLFLLKEVFDSLEKVIINKKLEFYLKNNICGIVVCNLCAKNKGLFICEECNDALCLSCKEKHKQNNLWEKHNITVLNLPLKKQSYQKNSVYGMTGDPIPFIKGEKFSFPFSTYQNLGYTNFQKIFDFFYKYYITYNGINENNNISLKEYMQFRLEYFTKIEFVPEKAFQNEIEEIIKKFDFNWTEIFYINRVCFKCFKYYGAKTTIDKAFEPLKKLQIGEFEEKLKILLNLLDIYDNKIIFKSEMEKYLGISLYQNYVENLSVGNILESIFPLESQFIEFNELYSCIIYKKHLLFIFKNLLQCDEINDDSKSE